MGKTESSYLTSSKMSEVELIYFGIHGRVFVTRLLMGLSGKPFKDTKITFEEFAKMKADLPLGQLPILKVDGETFCQSVAIMRFAAAQAGLPALDAKQELRSNMLVDSMTEIFDKTVGPAFAAANAGAAEDKAKNFYASIQDGAEETAKKIQKVLTMMKIEENGDATNQDLVSLADFFVLNAYVFFNDSKVKCAQQFQEFAPTAMGMVNRLTKLVKDADKINATVEEALAGQFTPF